MTAFLVLLFIALLGVGTVNDIKANQAREICRQKGIKNGVPEYSLLSVLAAGMGGIVAFIAAIMGNAVVTIVALAITVLVTFPYLKKSIETIPLMKKAGWGSGGMLRFQPYWIWARIVLLGMGKWTHVLMCCTLVGIPLYGMLKTANVNLEALSEQIELRQEYERLHK